MVVTIEIKQKTIFKKNFDLLAFIKKENLFYGSYNAYHVLRENRIDKHTIVFDCNEIGRGIEIDTENKNVILRLQLPATKNDIELFYHIAKEIAVELGLAYFFCEGTKFTFDEIQTCIDKDEKSSIQILENIEKKIYLTGDNNIVLFCALHPITFGEKEIDEVEGALSSFAKLLNRLQNQRLYYAVPAIYQKRTGGMIVAFHVDEEMPTVLPVEPVIYGPDKIELKDWFIFFAGGNTIRLETFYEYVPRKEYYDSNHYAVCLSEKDICELVENHSENLATGKTIKGYYFGMIIDSADLYQNDNKQDPLAPYSHIAIILEYCYKNNLLNNKFNEAVPEFGRVIDRKEDLREFVKNNRYIAGEVRIGFFNSTTRAFIDAYYNLDGEGYLNDLKVYGTSTGQSKGFLDIPYTEKNIENIEKIIKRAENLYFSQKEVDRMKEQI